MACHKDQPVDSGPASTPSPTPVVVVETPKPVNHGIYCPSGKPDFSPCNPNVPAAGSECLELGKEIVGCRSVVCKEAC